ncbi:Cyclin-dependent kinase 20 [Kappamyces sp. JEL0680]|nr:Cyclin-dependent kinase 20 [Kappamyces sp. JEL0680]
MNAYEIIDKIGEGAHGVVLKAKYVKTGQVVALKKVPLRSLSLGIPNTIIREIKALEQLDHPNIVKLREVFPSGTGFVLVFEYMLSDLAEVLKMATHPLSESQVKAYMLMLLKGIDYCHNNSIMHRDLKPASALPPLLTLLARVFASRDSGRPYSHQVATRWYRAPELLYGARVYDFGVDLWAVGCIFGELLNHSPIFPGQNDIDQLYSVIAALGSPTAESWPTMDQLPDYNKIQFPTTAGKPFECICPDASQEATALLSQFLQYNSLKRIPARKVDATSVA